jgi:hypothetical protein
MLPTTPRGANTSEFWLVVAAIILTVARAVATSLGLHFSPGADAQLNIATALPAIYAVARTWLKVHIPTVGNALPAEPSMPSFAPDVPQPSLADSVLPTSAGGFVAQPMPPIVPSATSEIVTPIPGATVTVAGDTPTQTVAAVPADPVPSAV